MGSDTSGLAVPSAGSVRRYRASETESAAIRAAGFDLYLAEDP